MSSRTTTLTACIALLLLLGCATPLPKLSRAQQLEAFTRTYPGVGVDQLLDAAERVLTLADGNDFKFAHLPTGMQASRIWSHYMVFAATIGQDFWSVEAQPTPDGTGVRASVTVARVVSGIVPMATTTPGTWSAGTVPPNSVPVQGDALYALFWSRVDYMLHRSDTWLDCKEWTKKRETSALSGPDEALCDALTIDDHQPGQAITRLIPTTPTTTQQWWVPKPPPETGPRAVDRPAKRPA